MEAADVALPISERFANPNTPRHELVDKLRIFAFTEYLSATADLKSSRDKLRNAGEERTAMRAFRVCERRANADEAAALFKPSGMLAIPSSRAAAFESTMSCVSVSFVIFGSLSLRQHPLSPARPRHGQIASGVREWAALSGSGNTHRNAPFRHEVQSDRWDRSR